MSLLKGIEERKKKQSNNIESKTSTSQDSLLSSIQKRTGTKSNSANEDENRLSRINAIMLANDINNRALRGVAADSNPLLRSSVPPSKRLYGTSDDGLRRRAAELVAYTENNPNSGIDSKALSDAVNRLTRDGNRDLIERIEKKRRINEATKSATQTSMSLEDIEKNLAESAKRSEDLKKRYTAANDALRIMTGNGNQAFEYSDFYKENEAILKQNLGEFADIEQLNRAIQNADRDVERYESEKRKYQYNEDMTKKYSGLQAQSDFSDLAKKGAATLPQYSSLTDVRNMSDSDVAALYINANEDDRRNIYNIHEYSGKVLNDLQYMNDQEIATYNAVRASEGEKAGKEYLEFIAPVLLRRGYFTQQEELETKVRDNAGYAVAQNVGTVLTSPLKGLDYLGAVINKATGGNDNDALGYVGDYTMSPANASEIVRSTTQENIKSPVLRFAYNTGMSVLDNVMNIAVTGGSGAATLALMGSGAASQTYSSAKAKGLTEDEALSMGLLSGVLETATESIGLDNLFSIIQKEGGQAGWELVKSIASQIGAEGTEEVLAEFGNAFLDRFVSGDLSDYNISVQRYMEDGLTADEANKKATSDFFKQVGEAFLSGGFSGGIMGGGAAAFNGITYNAAENRARGQEILDTMGYDNLRAFAQDVVENGSKAAEHRVSKAIDRIDGKTNTQAYLERNPQAAARVYDKVESAIGKQNKRFRDVADAIKKETSLPDSVSNKVARKITKDIVNRKNFKRSDYNSLLAGIDFTDADKNGNSDRKTRILDAIKSRFDITAKDFTERNAKYTAAMLGAERDENGKIVLGSTDEIADAEIDITDVTDAHVSDDGVTRNAAGEEIKLVGFDSVRNADGKVELVYKLDDGSTISTNDVEYASEDEAVLYESIANMGVNSLVANSFIKAYDPSTGVSPEAYVRGIAKAYRYGQYNLSMDSSSFGKELTLLQRRAAYKYGQIFAGKQIAKETAAIRAMKKEAPAGEKRIGSFKFDSEGKELNDQQRTGIKMMEHLSKLLGTDFYVFESYENESGHRVYKDATGAEQSAPNGWFDPSDNSFHIDLNAGDKGQGFMLFTISHELTHFIKEWSPAKFKVLANFLVEKYGTGRVEDLVKKQMEKARKNGRKTSYEDAFEEMVADSMETMLSSGNVVQDLAELKQRDKKLWDKIKEFFEKLVEDLKAVINAYKGADPTSVEGKLVADMTDCIEQFEKLFTDALYDASESYQRADAESKERGRVKDSNSGIAALYSDRDVTSWDIDWDEDNNSTIKSQMVKHMDAINEMKPVATVEFDKNNGKTYAEILDETLRTKFGYKIERTDGASFLFDKVAIATLRRYVKSDEEAAAVISAPYVLKRGKAISGHKNHKNLGNPSVTYAGAVVINGERVNVGVVVLFGTKNRPHSLRVLMPSGKEYVLSKIKTDPERKGASPNGDVRSSTGSAFKASVPQPSGGVKTSLRDEEYIDAVNRGDMETAQKMADQAATEAGYTIKAYHGTGRADRVGTVFRADRATSGPMAYFTDNREVAERYSRDKRDTSLAYDSDYDSYETQFRATTKKGAKYPLDMPVHRAWGYIDISKRNEIRKKAGQLREDWDGDGESFIFDPDTNEANGGFQWQLKEARGNVITALEDQWLNGGTLFNQEARFLEVLEMTGIKAELERVGFELSYKDPDYREEKVYDTYLRMTKPFDATKKVTEAFIKRFENWADKQPYGKYDRESQSADMWDKNDVSAEEFAERMREDLERGTSHAWTAIPDVMTDYLKHLHYDGIVDAGGKNGGVGHTVYIPFSSEQVKSAEPVTYDDAGNVIPLSERFNTEREDIRYSDRDPDAERVAEVLQKENAKLKEDVNYLKELLKLQKSVTHGKLLTRSSVEAAAGHLMNVTKARGEKAELVKLLNSFYEYIAAGEFLTWDGVVENAQPAIKWLQDHIVEKKQIDEYSAGILREIRNSRFRLDDLQKKEVAYYYGSYNNFRKQSMGSFIIAENGSAFDTRWQELSEMYPDVFDPEISSNDMPNELMNIVDRLRNTDMGMEYTYDQELIEQDLLHQVYDSYWNVSTLRTVADVKQKEINRLKGTHAKRMAELRDYHKEQTAKLKKEYSEKLKSARQEYRKRSDEKQKEIIDRYRKSKERAKESRDKTEMRRKIKSVVSELNSLLLHGTKDKHIMVNLQKVVAEALDLVNMDTVDADARVAKYNALIAKATDPDVIKSLTETRDRIQNQGDKFKAKMDNLKSAYANIKNSDDPLVANAYDEVIAQRMDHVAEVVGNTSLRDMSLEQLGEVYEMYKMVLTTVRNSNKAFKAKRNETISVLANRTMEEIHKIGGTKQLALKALQGMKAFSWNNLKPVYALRAIGSDTFTEAFDNVRAGEDTWAVDVTDAKKFFENISKKYGYKNWDFKKRYGFKSTTGVDFELSLEQILSLYAYSKREQADKHLEKGGFVFDSAIEVVKKGKGGIPLKYTVNTSTAHNLSKEGLAKIIGTLSEDQKMFVDIMQGYLSDVMGAKGNEVSLEMYGVKLFKELNYFPLKSANQFMFEQNETAGEVKIKNSGFSKETVVNASNPIILSNFMDVWANHVNDMSMYHAFVLPLEDFNRIFNYKTPTSEKMNTESVKMYMQNAYGTQSTDYIKQLLKDLNGGVRSDPRESTGKKLISRFKKSAVMASWSVVVQQPSAVARALAVIDAKYFDFNPKLIQHKKLWNEVKKYAPVAIIKEMGRFDTDMGRSTVDYIKNEATFMEKVDDVLSKPAAYADELTWCHIWTAVKRETLKTRKDLQFGSEAFLKAAGERFTEVIVKTQVYDSVLARSANMRSKSVFMNMVTSFMAEPTTSMNMAIDALRQGKRGDKRYARKAVGAVYASLILNAALSSIVYAMRDDDDDETALEKYVGSFTTEIIDSFNPLTYLPFIKDAWSIAQGYDVERSDMSLISDAIGSFQNIVKLVETDTDGMDDEELAAYNEKLRDAILSGVDGIASLLGIPEKNLRRDIESAFNTYKTFTNGLEEDATSMWEQVIDAAKNSTPIWGWMKDEAKEDKLYEAILNGDAAYRKRIESQYDDQNAVDNAIRKALRNNDPRIKQAAEAYYNGNIAEYTRIAKAVIADGFKQDNVVKAIMTEVNGLKPDEDTDTSSKVTGLYKTEAFIQAIMSGDQATADLVRKDLIDTMVANGKTEEEATKSLEGSVSKDCREKFMEGNLTETEAIEVLVNYCGNERDAAEEKVGKWSFEVDYGFSWDDKSDAYKNGEISASELKAVLMDVGGKTAEDADLQVQIYDWQKEVPNCDDITASAIKDYNEICKPAGVSKSVYYKAWRDFEDTPSDYDSNGEAVRYSKTEKVMPKINALPISSDQKTALALCWWVEGTVNKYKLW